jgi:hypothetical protein
MGPLIFSHSFQSFRVFEGGSLHKLAHDDIDIKRRLSAASLNVILMLVGLGNEYPHLQCFFGILFPKPNSQTIEICLWHNILLISLGQSYVLCDENYQQVSATKLKIFIIAHYWQQLVEASVVVKNGGMRCAFHFQVLKRSCYGPLNIVAF